MKRLVDRASFIGLATWLCLLPSLALSEPYTVKNGDTLSHIARVHGTTVRELKVANHVHNVNVIYSGQVLIIPERHATVNVSSSEKTARSVAAAPARRIAVAPAWSTGADSEEIQALRAGLDRGWVVTRNSSLDSNKLFVHASSSNGYLQDLRYLVRENADGQTWTVYLPNTAGGSTQYGRKVGVISRPANVSVGACSCM